MNPPNTSFITTADGSKTIYNPIVGEHYHSINGALQESMHVFVKSGLNYYHQVNESTEISVLEVGFGTGLNFLLSADYAIKNKISLEYVGIEAFPLSKEIIGETNYDSYLDNNSIWTNFLNNYSDSFSNPKEISHEVTLQLYAGKLLSFNSIKKFDLIYFDAFAKTKQAEMWSEESIKCACNFLKDKGIFVTYSVTGDLKRTLKSLGFEIQRPAGAAGKREMMRATFNKENAL